MLKACGARELRKWREMPLLKFHYPLDRSFQTAHRVAVLGLRALPAQSERVRQTRSPEPPSLLPGTSDQPTSILRFHFSCWAEWSASCFTNCTTSSHSAGCCSRSWPSKCRTESMKKVSPAGNVADSAWKTSVIAASPSYLAPGATAQPSTCALSHPRAHVNACGHAAAARLWQQRPVFRRLHERTVVDRDAPRRDLDALRSPRRHLCCCGNVAEENDL